MNRIQLPSWKQGSLGSNSAASQDSTCQAAQDATDASTHDPGLLAGDSTQLHDDLRATSGDLRYALFGPLHYEPNYDYPLLVWLHGSRDDERQVQQIMPHVSLRNYVAIGPRATCRAHDDVAAFHWGSSFAGILQAERAVFDSVAVATERFRVNPSRIFLAGYGGGGTMALRIALRNPELFAGAATIGGRFPRGHMPLVALPRIPGLKLFMGHGRDSQAYSVDELCADLRLFHTARLAVAVRQYPTADELREPMLRDLDRWMMSIVTGQPMEEPEPTEDELPAADAN